MNTRILYHLALSDFRERSRRYSFLVMLALAVYLGYTVNNGDFSLTLGRYRGVLNSAWVGAQMVLVLTTMLSLFGFYLVRNSIERDTRTGVGQIIAATPISRPVYLLGKWLSHFVVLGVLVLILAAAALIMQLWRHEAPVDALALLAPFLVLALPCVGLTAGLAVLFESISWLRGGFGSFAYFILWIAALPVIITSMNPNDQVTRTIIDPLGMGALVPSMQTSLLEQHPDYEGSFTLGADREVGELVAFQWNGPDWNAARIAGQWAWTFVGAGLALLGSLFFERFDPSRSRPRRAKQTKVVQPETDSLAGLAAMAAISVVTTTAPAVHTRAATIPVHLTPLTRRPALSARAFPAIYLAELRLMLKGQPWWWYAIAAGLIIAGVISPLAITKTGWLPAAWIWPVLIWSTLGCRERHFDTHQLIFSAPHPLAVQLPAAWLAGVTVTALTGLGGGLVFLLAGDSAAFTSWLAAILFLPALALALGTWSGSSRPFEIVYLIWWYLGPLQHAGQLDFLATPAPIYLGITAVLLVAALLGRWLQVKG